MYLEVNFTKHLFNNLLDIYNLSLIIDGIITYYGI